MNERLTSLRRSFSPHALLQASIALGSVRSALRPDGSSQEAQLAMLRLHEDVLEATFAPDALSTSCESLFQQARTLLARLDSIASHLDQARATLHTFLSFEREATDTVRELPAARKTSAGRGERRSPSSTTLRAATGHRARS